MGYLSNVRICLAKKDIRKLKKELLKVKSNIWNVCDIKYEFVDADGLLYVIFGWQKIEWYLFYSDIFIIMKLLKNFKARGIPFKFLRVGQDKNDVEIDSSYEKKLTIDNVNLLQTMMNV